MLLREGVVAEAEEEGGRGREEWCECVIGAGGWEEGGRGSYATTPSSRLVMVASTLWVLTGPERERTIILADSR